MAPIKAAVWLPSSCLWSSPPPPRAPQGPQCQPQQWREIRWY